MSQVILFDQIAIVEVTDNNRAALTGLLRDLTLDGINSFISGHQTALYQTKADIDLKTRLLHHPDKKSICCRIMLSVKDGKVEIAGKDVKSSFVVFAKTNPAGAMVVVHTPADPQNRFAHYGSAADIFTYRKVAMEQAKNKMIAEGGFKLPDDPAGNGGNTMTAADPQRITAHSSGIFRLGWLGL
jgi:hypothetical protein